MRVSDIHRRVDGSVLELSATVSGLPGPQAQRGWIRVPAEAAAAEDPLSDGATWMAAMLPAALVLGQPLELEAPVSSRLLAGARKVMRVFSGWHRPLRPVELRPAEEGEDGRRPEAVASFFSAGVDSSYTLLKHLRDPRFASPSHAILIHGYDYPIRGRLRDEVAGRVGAVTEALGVSLLEIETNLREINDPVVPWGPLQHGPLLAAVAHSVTGFGRVMIPAGASFNSLYHWSSHPFTDPLWSSEATGIVHDGCEANRIDKVLWQLADCEPVLANLRVCFRNPDGAYNCGRCGKCQRTMVTLELAGVRDRAPLFPGDPDPAALEAVEISGTAARAQTENLIEALAEREAMPEIRRALRRSLRRTPARLRADLAGRSMSRLRLERDRRLPRARLRR